MEESIESFCRTLASFSNHLATSCDALSQSVRRRPIPLDSASCTFIQRLNRRVWSVSSELNLLESMSLGTVSFEELLGHFNEVYKNNQSQLLHLQDILEPLGYVPEIETGDVDQLLDDDSPVPLDVDSKIADSNRAQVCLDDDDLFDDSLSFKKIGLSNVCLESLASEANRKIDDLGVYSHEPVKDRPDDLKDTGRMLGVTKETRHLDFDEVDDSKPIQALTSTIKLLKDDYESLPSYMKGLTSWEDLLTAVDKINSNLIQRKSGTNFFHQNEIPSLDLGPKERSYLLLLVRMNRLKVETIDGLISYRVL